MNIFCNYKNSVYKYFGSVKYICFALLISKLSYAQNYDISKGPKFSVKRGFYTTAFDLIVDAETTSAKIYYTLDGSDPRKSPTVQQKTSPATIRIDPESTDGLRAKAPGFVIRACSQVSGMQRSQSVTHTYFFVNKATALSPEGKAPGPNWPSPGKYPQFIDYGMSSSVINDSRYKNLISNSLLSIPSLSLSTDLKNLFSSDSGIYMNALSDGVAWERPASIELVNPDNTDGFQINAGLRIRGGYSRHPENPKHAYRLFFKSEYGEGKLKYKLFGDEGVDEFDKLDLRTSQHYSWSYPDHLGDYNTMTRDVFSRDLQREIGQPYTRSRYYHLYINGVYWGIFQTQERSEARYAASYFGGSEENYDVIKNDEGQVISTDGNINAYNEMYKFSVAGFSSITSYFKIQGQNINGTINNTYKKYLDVDNLIDYMMIIFYTGNFDSPVSKFAGDQMPNNFYCIYDRTKNEGFKFFAHDAEHSLRTTEGEGPGIGVNENRVSVTMSVGSVSQFQPQYLHNKLTVNQEYRIRFADHVYKLFFNNGQMTPEKTATLFTSRTEEIEMAIIGESARWGDTYYSPKTPGLPRTKDDHWKWAINDLLTNYFPVRTGIVLNQLKSANLYPNIEPPLYKQNSDTVKEESLKIISGSTLKLINPNGTNGTIYYTVDGNDPRKIGGGIVSTALNGGDETDITVSKTVVLKSRILNGATWSALHEIILFADENIRDLKITEINYHPLDNGTVNNDEYEFLEMKNIGSSPINLSGAKFTDGITYTFPVGTIIDSNKQLVLSSNNVEFNKRYGFFAFSEYTGQLDNGGEKLTLLTGTNDTIFSVTYNDNLPWDVTADGAGYSLVPKEINPTGDLNLASNWRASLDIHGSPGRDDVIKTGIKTNEKPSNFVLYQNYPNPFNPTTNISYNLSANAFTTLIIYDLLGREIKSLVSEVKTAGYHSEIFNASDNASGIYYYILSSGSNSEIKKLVILK